MLITLSVCGEYMVDNKSQIEHSISQVRKRDGSVSDFNRDKILNAIHKAFSASNNQIRNLRPNSAMAY